MLLPHFLLLAGVVHASSWFSTTSDYAKWSHEELRAWLEYHNIKVPASFDKPHLQDLVDANWQSLSSSLAGHAEPGSQWSLDQYIRAQHTFQHIKDDSFDQWDESRLRALLLKQGVVAPSGPREKLVLLAKNKYRAYTDAAALHSSLASGSILSAYASATDAAHSTSQYISTAAAQATDEVTRAFDHTKDYVYSAWDDSRLRNWLKDNGVFEAKVARSKDELEKLAGDFYRKTVSAVWESWSDSYIREWLISHNLIKPSDVLSRSDLLGEMKKYYYSCSDSVWNTWSDSQLKSWLIEHHLLKGDAEKSHDELVKMVEEHYLSASDNVWRAWTDSDIRQWLSERGYLEGGNTESRKYLVDLINNKHPAPEKAASYLVWPDARLRAYLRERGIGENALPTSRPGLLQEARTRWAQTSTKTETVFVKLKEIINSSVEAVEEKIAQVLEVLSGHSRDVCDPSVDDASSCTHAKQVWSRESDRVNEAREIGEEIGQSAHDKGDGAIKRASQWVRQKVQGVADEL